MEGRTVYREVRTCKQKLRRKRGGTRRDEGRKEENERKLFRHVVGKGSCQRSAKSEMMFVDQLKLNFNFFLLESVYSSSFSFSMFSCIQSNLN